MAFQKFVLTAVVLLIVFAWQATNRYVLVPLASGQSFIIHDKWHQKATTCLVGGEKAVCFPTLDLNSKTLSGKYHQLNHIE